MVKPTMMFVPGSWHTTEIYDKTREILHSNGYPTTAIQLPSVGADPPHTGFEGDVKGIRECLRGLIEEQGKDVILVSHSYSGMPAVEAPIRLAKSQREAQGLKGGVVRLVFIMAFAMPEGFQPTAAGTPIPSWMKVDGDIVHVLPHDAKEIFYNDLTSEEGDIWAAKLQSESMAVYSSTTTYAAWRYIPSTYVIATEDKTTFTLELVNYMIDSARQQVPTAFDVVETCEGAGHCLMISRPEWLAEVMRRAAGEPV